MAKDPAFLFYPGDYLRDTQCLSEPVQVAYDRIMCEHMRYSLISKKQFDFFTKKLSQSEKEELLMVLTETSEGYQITWVVESIEKRKAFTESRRKSRLKSDEDNVRIYIVRDNVRSTYKIGSSVNPLRRYNELSNQKNPAIMGDEAGERDLTLIWYSDPVQRSEEKRLHNQFINKNIYGEWFNLTEEDINLITKKINGTYVQRTEDEIENENINEFVVKDKGVKGEKEILTPSEITHTIEFISITTKRDLNEAEVHNYWNAFKIHSEAKSYANHSEMVQHFRNWLKKQDKPKNGLRNDSGKSLIEKHMEVNKILKQKYANESANNL